LFLKSREKFSFQGVQQTEFSSTDPVVIMNRQKGNYALMFDLYLIVVSRFLSALLRKIVYVSSDYNKVPESMELYKQQNFISQIY
jgi:hypothetical protein